MPHGHCLGSLEIVQQKLTISSQVALYYQGGKYLGALALLKTRHTGLDVCLVRETDNGIPVSSIIVEHNFNKDTKFLHKYFKKKTKKKTNSV